METFRYKDEKKGREENATRTEYNNERKQWGPIPESLLGGLHIQRYIDKSVLVENRPLVKFIQTYIRGSSGVLSISSLVRISMTSFPALTVACAKILLSNI